MNQNTASAREGSRPRGITTKIGHSRLVAVLTGAAQSAVLLLPMLLALVFALPERIRAAGRSERGDAGGKGLIILITTVIGIGVAIAIGVLIKAQIDKRTPGLDQ